MAESPCDAQRVGMMNKIKSLSMAVATPVARPCIAVEYTVNVSFCIRIR